MWKVRSLTSETWPPAHWARTRTLHDSETGGSTDAEASRWAASRPEKRVGHVWPLSRESWAVKLVIGPLAVQEIVLASPTYQTSLAFGLVTLRTGWATTRTVTSSSPSTRRNSGKTPRTRRTASSVAGPGIVTVALRAEPEMSWRSSWKVWPLSDEEWIR